MQQMSICRCRPEQFEEERGEGKSGDRYLIKYRVERERGAQKDIAGQVKLSTSFPPPAIAATFPCSCLPSEKSLLRCPSRTATEFILFVAAQGLAARHLKCETATRAGSSSKRIRQVTPPIPWILFGSKLVRTFVRFSRNAKSTLEMTV